MTDLSNFTFLGFDFRLAENRIKTVDSSVWLQSELVYQKMLRIGCSENLVQLVDCTADLVETNLNSNTIGVAVAVSNAGLNIMEGLFGGAFIAQPQSPEFLLKRGWQFEGFDVADANGYFSVFGIDSENLKLPIPKNLFKSEPEASSLIDQAEILYPSHAPFVVFALLTYKTRHSS